VVVGGPYLAQNDDAQTRPVGELRNVKRYRFSHELVKRYIFSHELLHKFVVASKRRSTIMGLEPTTFR